MNIIFFGTPNFVVPVLEKLTRALGIETIAVVTQPDRLVGRRQILTPSPVKLFSQKHKIRVIDSALMIYIIKAIRDLAPDIGVLAAYGKILPIELINLFPKGILVIHPSLLPTYRGASPVQAAIINGDRETGVTIIKMDEKMDHGPIIAQFKEEIKNNDTAETLYARLFRMAAGVLITILPAWVEGRIKPREQDHTKATFTKIFKKEDGKIDWKWSPEKIERFIRAMTPWPGAFTNVKLKIKNEKLTKRLKILKAHFETIQDRKAKPILDRNSFAKLVLVLDQVQLEGKKPVSWKEFQKGYPNFTLN